MQEGRALLSEAEEAVSQDRYAAAHAPLASAAAKLQLARDEPGLARVRELEVFQHFVLYVCTSKARTRSQLQRVN